MVRPTTFNENKNKKSLTTGQLHPAADMEDGGRVHEEEEHQRGDAQRREAHRKADEDCGRLEGGRLDAAKVVEAALADQILPILQQPTRSPQAEVAGAGRGGRVTEPLRLHEHHHVDDGEAQAEDRPQHADRARVARVEVPRLEHVHAHTARGVARRLATGRQTAHATRDT